MLTIADVSKSYGTRTLFAEVSLFIARTDRYGLVGPNGAGKTTLFNLILGEEAPDERHDRVGAGRRLRLPAPGERPGGRGDRSSRWRRAAASSSRSSDDDYDIDWTLEPRAKKILAGLGFREGDCDQAGEDVLRRLGHARPPRRPARRRALAPPPRRADQPPRPRGPALVPGLPHALPGRPRRHLPRPGLPQHPLHRHPRAARRHAQPLHRQLRRLPRREGGAARPSRPPPSRTSSARSPTCSGSSTASAPRPPCASRAKSKEKQIERLKEVAVEEPRGRPEEDPLQVPEAAALGPQGGQARARPAGLRRPRRLPGPELHGRARPAHRARRPERRRQVDPAQDPRRRRPDPGRHLRARQQRRPGLLRAEPPRQPQRRRAPCWRT